MPALLTKILIWSQLSLDFFEGRRQLLAIGEIGFHSESWDTPRLKFVYHALIFFFVAGHNRNRGAGLSQAQGNPATDPTVPAGYHSHASA